MTKKEKEKNRPLLEQGLSTALQALDSQIARAIQRSPAEREVHGVQKWDPIQQRVETVCAHVLNGIGDEEFTLDGVLVLAQAFTKGLALLVDELGEEGLGAIRSKYCAAALESIVTDGERSLRQLRGRAELS